MPDPELPDSGPLLSAHGVSVPRLLYGTAWKKLQTAGLVEKALRAGFRGVDTACQPKHYHEAGVGDGVAACLNHTLRRENLYLQTKFTPLSGQDPKKVPYDPRASLADQVLQSFTRSLLNLQTDYVDCLVLHSPLRNPQMRTVWEAMERIVDSGQVKQLGISNCYSLELLESLYASVRVKPAVLQNRFYAETGYDRELRSFCGQHAIIYQSFWTLTANPHILAGAAVQTLAGKYQRTPAQVLFRYLLQRQVVPLTGTRSELHMREDMNVFEFNLTADECTSLDAWF